MDFLREVNGGNLKKLESLLSVAGDLRLRNVFFRRGLEKEEGGGGTVEGEEGRGEREVE